METQVLLPYNSIIYLPGTAAGNSKESIQKQHWYVKTANHAMNIHFSHLGLMQ